ncbi:hypothetical protein ACFY3V_37270 [Streptosporangium sp. NPDC000095]|uniref:hypothetical protein n=1 Tax=Streptosporangium sp. NPDC000095 TaxID=3366184 RepID=UPI0036B3D961
MRVLGALALALVLTGCGTAGDDADVASATGGGDKPAVSAAPSLDQHEKGIKFAQCMRENGVDMPDPEPGKGVAVRIGKGTSKEAMEKATAACKEFSPMGDAGPGGGTDPQRAESMREFAKCMRENGVEEFPDPEGGGLRVTGAIGEDPDFQTAQEKCSKKFLPEAGQGGS